MKVILEVSNYFLLPYLAQVERETVTKLCSSSSKIKTHCAYLFKWKQTLKFQSYVVRFTHKING